MARLLSVKTLPDDTVNLSVAVWSTLAWRPSARRSSKVLVSTVTVLLASPRAKKLMPLLPGTAEPAVSVKLLPVIAMVSVPEVLRTFI